jgi:hypothetical protein
MEAVNMVDPSTIATLAAPILGEAIKSLVGLAGDALRRWRDNKSARAAAGEGATAPPTDQVAATFEMPNIIEGELKPIHYNVDRVERFEDDLKEFRRQLTDYADGIEAVDANDPRLTANAESLRRVLEAVIGQRITFKGEDRPASGPIVEGEVDVDRVQGDAAAVRARLVTGGTVTGVARAKMVEPGGKLTGVDVDEIRGG